MIERLKLRREKERRWPVKGADEKKKKFVCGRMTVARPGVEGGGGSSFPFAHMSATHDSAYTGSQLHADVEAGKVSGFYGGSYISKQDYKPRFKNLAPPV